MKIKHELYWLPITLLAAVCGCEAEYGNDNFPDEADATGLTDKFDEEDEIFASPFIQSEFDTEEQQDTSESNSTEVRPVSVQHALGCAWTSLGCGKWTYYEPEWMLGQSIRVRVCSFIGDDCKKHYYSDVECYFLGWGDC